MKLRGKTKIVFFGHTDQKLWVFEVSRRSLGRAACAGANQQELTTCTKSGGHEEKTFQEKWELPHRRRCRPAAGGRPLVTGRPWGADLRLWDSSNFFEIFLF
jgi:hypothetical protein